MEADSHRPWWLSTVIETIKTVAYVLAITLFIRTFLFQPFNIPSSSMKDTLLVGDYIIVSKYSHGYSRHSFCRSHPSLGAFGRRSQSAATLSSSANLRIFRSTTSSA